MDEHPISPGPYVMGGTHTQTPPIPSTPLAALQGRAPPEPPVHHPLGGQGGGHGHFKGHYAQPYSPRSIPQLPKKEKNHKKKKNHQKKEGSRAAARPESLQERAGSAEAPRCREQGACRGILLAQQSDPGRWVFPPPTLLCWKTSPRAGAEELGVGF